MIRINTNSARGSSRSQIAFALTLIIVLLPLVPTSRRSSAAPATAVTSGLAVTFNQVADSATSIPDGTGTFTNFPYSPAIDNGNVTLVGTGVGGQQVISRFRPVPPPIKVADLNTAISEGSGTFTDFAGSPTISGDAVAFLGMGASGQQGIYSRLGPVPPPIKVADLFTPIPNGSGNFTNFSPVDPCIDGSLVVFIGSGSIVGGAEQQGVYLVDVARPTPPPIIPIADKNTAIPGDSGNFYRFVPPNPTAPSISGNYLVFFGAGSEIGQEGIYIVDTSKPNPPPIIPVADRNTVVPGEEGNFHFFSAFASEGNNVAFVGGRIVLDEQIPGVYKVLNVLTPTPPPIKVADLFTAVPSGIGNFTSFGSVAIDPGTVVFEGLSSDGNDGTRKGLYTDFGGTLAKLIATGDTLGGKVVSDLRFGPHGFSNQQAVFAADFSDGTHAVLMASLNPTPTPTPTSTPTPSPTPISTVTAADDSCGTAQDTPLTIIAPGVLNNDGDPHSSTLTAHLVSGPASGIINLNVDGSFSYTPNSGFIGTDSFTYRADDGAATSNAATVTIVVSPISNVDVPRWTATASLNVKRLDHTATLLPNGKVLVAGGVTDSGSGPFATNSAELYDPATRRWSRTGSLNTGRSGHTATLLQNGKVLVAGGFNSSGNPLLSAELYNPATETWSRTGNLNVARSFYTTTLLSNGKVLVVGGSTNKSSNTNGAELYDPASGRWSATGNLRVARYGHTATLLPNNKVMVAGGFTPGRFSPINSVELYDPAAGTWSSTDNLNFARGGHTATLLPDNTVLVAGGLGKGFQNSTEVYSPVAGTWRATGKLNVARSFHTATLSPGGEVVVTGGVNDSGSLDSSELYGVIGPGVWSLSNRLNLGRVGHTATVMFDSNILVVGGYNYELKEAQSSSEGGKTGDLNILTGGSGSSIFSTCPFNKPYCHVTWYGQAYCSAYP